MSIKIAIVDDKQSNRIILGEKLAENKDFEIVFTAINGEDFLEKMKLQKQNLPNVVLMDLEMPHMDGIDAIANGSALYDQVKFIVLTVFDEDEKIFRAIRAGACGYLLKEETAETIAESISMAIENGGVPMSPSVARRTLSLLSNSNFTKNEKAEIINNELFDLSERETDILKLLVDGKEYKEIAELLYISPFTVRNHTTKIYSKLHVNSKAEAISLAYKKKLV
jgi:DNA-binding NarL/FixJ family response regulator